MPPSTDQLAFVSLLKSRENTTQPSDLFLKMLPHTLEKTNRVLCHFFTSSPSWAGSGLDYYDIYPIGFRRQLSGNSHPRALQTSSPNHQTKPHPINSFFLQSTHKKTPTSFPSRPTVQQSLSNIAYPRFVQNLL